MTRPYRLLSIAHSYVLPVNRRLAHEIARAGAGRWDVTAVAPAFFHGANDIRPLPFQPAADEACRVEVVPARLTGHVHMFHYGRRLRSLLREGWDLVHAWEEPYIVAGGQIAWWTPRGTPLVYRTAQSLDKQYPPPFGWIERRSMRRAAGWICSGRLVAEALGSRSLYQDRPMRRIPLGVDLNLFCINRNLGRETLHALGWAADGAPIVGFLGRLSKAKGVEVLMQALDHLTVPWRALFVGDGPMRQEIRSWAARQGDRVRVCTEVRHEDVPRYINAMDVLAAPSLTTPSWREQFGRMLIEAFACGVPVIGSDSGEIPYVIGDAGVVVPEGDARAWSDAIGALLEAAERRAELAALGLARARAEYAWPVVARQYLSFFEGLLESRSSPH